MSYVLATTENVVRWYVFDTTNADNGFELINELDLKRVPMLADKVTAKKYAAALDLKSFRYVKV